MMSFFFFFQGDVPRVEGTDYFFPLQTAYAHRWMATRGVLTFRGRSTHKLNDQVANGDV